MKVLLDTHLLMRAMISPERLPASLLAQMEDPDEQVNFSVVSIWEAAIKWGRGRPDFQFDPRLFREHLLNQKLTELHVKGEHAQAVADLPPIHKDPFDRILIAQATIEGITLLTSDRKLTAYPGPIQLV